MYMYLYIHSLYAFRIGKKEDKKKFETLPKKNESFARNQDICNNGRVLTYKFVVGCAIRNFR